MSQQAVGEFWKKIDTDTGFQEEFLKAVPKQLSNGAPIVEFASRHGFEFTEQEFQQAAAAVGGQGDLSDAQLEAVAGGIIIPETDRTFTDGTFSRRILRSFAGLDRSIGDVAV